MKHFQNINTLIFDFGGVLINLDKNRCVLNFKRLGIGEVERYLNNFAQLGIFMQLEIGEISAEQFRDEIRKMTSNTLSDEQIDDAWNSFLMDIPSEKIDLLLELRKKYRLIMLSNTNSIHFPTCIDTFFQQKGRMLHDCFDKCYLSYEMGMAKPNPEIFETILKNEQVTANECLLLDDGIKNIEQAQKLGIQTYLVKEREDLSFLLNAETWK